MKSAIKKIFVLAGCVLLFVTSMRAQRACLNLSETLWNITLVRGEKRSVSICGQPEKA